MLHLLTDYKEENDFIPKKTLITVPSNASGKNLKSDFIDGFAPGTTFTINEFNPLNLRPKTNSGGHPIIIIGEQRSGKTYTVRDLIGKYFSSNPRRRKVLVLSMKENMGSPFWRPFFGESNPDVEYVDWFYGNPMKFKDENPRLMEWCRENMDKSLEKIVIIDDYSDKDALSPKNSQFINHLFCVVPEFNFTTLLFTHKFNDTDIKHRNNANCFINFSPLTASINRARAGGTATKILDNKLGLYETFAKQLRIKHSRCAYISMDIRRMESQEIEKIDEQEQIEQMAWWYVADKEFKMPSEEEQRRWFGYVEGVMRYGNDEDIDFGGYPSLRIDDDDNASNVSTITSASASSTRSINSKVANMVLSPLTDDDDISL